MHCLFQVIRVAISLPITAASLGKPYLPLDQAFRIAEILGCVSNFLKHHFTYCRDVATNQPFTIFDIRGRSGRPPSEL